LGHPPALGQAWHLDAGTGGSLTTALNAENCFSVFSSPHSGHAGPLLLADLTSTSFTNPHCEHLYSKIGIIFPLSSVINIAKQKRRRHSILCRRRILPHQKLLSNRYPSGGSSGAVSSGTLWKT
jgi:hypothetical protein